MTKRKCAILCPGYGWVARGAERFVEEIVHRLDEELEFDVYTLAMKKQLGDNIMQRHVLAISRTSPLASFCSRIADRLGSQHSSLIDFECLSFALMVAPRLLFNRYDSIINLSGYFGGLICNVHRSIYKSLIVYSGQAGIGWVDEMMAALAPDVFVALSPPAEKWIKGRFPSLPVTMIPNGVDASRFAPDVQPMSLKMSRPIVIFVGAMEPMKRPHLAIQAVARLKRVSLLMIGDGPLSQEMELLGRGMLGTERFQRIAHVSNEGLPKYYNACDLFTLPSHEPFGIVFLEAMACNKAVVAQAGPVQEWIIGDAGITCDCENVDAYAAAIKKALVVDFNDRPRKRALNFGWEDIACQYQVLMNQLLQPNQRTDRTSQEELYGN